MPSGTVYESALLPAGYAISTSPSNRTPSTLARLPSPYVSIDTSEGRHVNDVRPISTSEGMTKSVTSGQVELRSTVVTAYPVPPIVTVSATVTLPYPLWNPSATADPPTTE